MTLEVVGRQYTGIPDIPMSYWEHMRTVEPAFPMGKETRPKTWIIGCNGPRGGGKSGTAAVLAAAQFLLRGIHVYAIPETYYISVPILWNGKVYRFHSEPLDIELLIKFDPSLRRSCILADEANMQLADSHRAMANKNLAISDYAQQCRHHDVSMLYTVIMAGWIDPRLRQLTDVLLYCTDASNSPSGEEYGLEEGEWVNIIRTDNSGLLTGTPYDIDPQQQSYSYRLKDFWPIYESKNITDSQKARRNIQYTGNKIQVEIGGDSPEAEGLRAFGEQIEDVLMHFARTLPEDSNGRVLLRAKDLWANLGVEGDQKAVSQTGIILSNYGIKKVPRGDGSYYDLTNLRNP